MDTPAGPSLVGLTVDNRYEITQRLAHGGMATVYRAIDTRLDREVALKILRPNMAEDPKVIEKFEAEAKNTAKINHPHVINVYDQGVGSAGNGTVAFLAMEFIEGHTLRDVLRTAGQMPEHDVWKIALPIIRGVAAAHQVGLVHRDIKPENVLVSHAGAIKVADFGLARAASNHTGTGMALMGTVSYMSPELVTGEQADERSDVYALGILLFEMLTGKRPYAGESAVSIAVQHTNSRVPAPSTVVPSITAEVDDLILHMTEPVPDDRPADATEVLILIRHLLEQPRESERPTQPQQTGEPAPSSTSAQPQEYITVNAPDFDTDRPTQQEPPPPPQPNVTVLPPSVTAEATPMGAMDHYQRPSAETRLVGAFQHRDLSRKKPHDPIHDFATIKPSQAAFKTILLIMAAAATLLLGNWVGSALIAWLLG